VKRRRRCCLCKALFMPDPRVGDRQRTCGQTSCKAERHRLACIEWRQREQAAVQRYLVRRRLGSPELSRDVVRDELGPKMAVVIEEVFRLVVLGSRDAFASRRLELSQQSFRLVDRTGKDPTAAMGPGP
jgi:hypothetical protein